jgi:hypothetical protein
MKYSKLTKVSGFLLLAIIALFTGCNTQDINGKTQCGYLAQCPDNYTTEYIGGQCLICHKNTTSNTKLNYSFYTNEIETTIQCGINYNNLNYTILKISRKEFEKLDCLRQTDWINGICYPKNCNIPNPPVCRTEVMVMCHPEEDLERDNYFVNMWINKNNISEVSADSSHS